MNYKDKTKEQPINELTELHQRIEDLEAEATKRKKAEESLREAKLLKGILTVSDRLRKSFDRLTVFF
jgi:hypothetical protein